MVPGTSLGGARPKATFADAEATLWMAKFPANDDRRDVGAWEYLAHLLSEQCGIDRPAARLSDFGTRHRTFCAKRFDRDESGRRHYLSAMSMVNKQDGDSGSYLEIAEAIQMHGDPDSIDRELRQLYRRIVFSILIGNRDDHFRNHGFLRHRNGWRLSPAFDINPNPDKDTHALCIDESDATPEAALLSSTARHYRLTKAQATDIESAVRNAIANWEDVARTIDIPRTEIRQLAGIIDPLRK